MPEARAQIQELPLDRLPKLDGRVELSLDPARPVSERVIETAIDDHRDHIGLQVEDEQTRYIVVDSGVQRVEKPRVIEKKVGLPRFQPHKHGERIRFGRPTLRTNLESNGIPAIHIYGKVITPEFHKNRLPPIVLEIPSVTVAEVEVETGDVKFFGQIARDEFYRRVDELGDGDTANVKAAWRSKPERGDRLDLTLSPRTKESPGSMEFEELDAQLKANGIRRWDSLSWQNGTKTYSIVWDDEIKKPAVRGFKPTWARRFGVKTVEDGNITAFKAMHIVELADFLAACNGNKTAPLRNLHFYKQEPQPESAVVQARDELRLQKLLKHIGGDSLRGRALSRLLPGRVATKAALWLLSEPEIPNQGGEDTPKARRARAVSDPARRSGFNTLKSAIVEPGNLLHVYDAALGIRNQQIRALRELDIPFGAEDYSISKVVRAMYARANRSSGSTPIKDMLGAEPAAEANRQAIVDELVGRMVCRIATPAHGKEVYDKALIIETRDFAPTGAVNALGMPMQEVAVSLELNEEGFFESRDLLPTLNVYNKLWLKRQGLRDPAIEAARKIFEQIKKGDQPDAMDFQELGHYIRRLASVSPAL